MDTHRIDCAVVGAGVVGLAVARALALQGRETILLEAATSIGTGTSSRNSEVIHAGIYYPTGSLKAALCVRGKELLYEFCNNRQVHCKRLGKVLVAVVDGEIPLLEQYRERAETNGVFDLEMLSSAQMRRLEPAVKSVAALFSPSTGIIDSHEFMLALLADFESAGGLLVRRAPVTGAERTGSGIVIDVSGTTPVRLEANTVINCAGLGAQRLAAAVAGHAPHSVPGLHYAIGHYFSFNRGSPFGHLIYPMPTVGGLGVHVTLDLAGRARFGPDVSWRESCDYSFDVERVGKFYEAIRRYFPALPDHSLEPAYTGIRPKLAGPGAPDQDFVIQTQESHGVPGWLNLFGIESPGLTASLAIGELVARLRC